MSHEVKRPEVATTAKTMRFTIDSDFSCCRQMQQQIEDELEKLGYCESALFAIKLALEEAIVNAIKHGNKFQSGKKVHVYAELSPQQARLTIEDEGAGFTRCCVPDPRCTENLEKCTGRGILLIESYMDEVCWSNDGRRISMLRLNHG